MAGVDRPALAAADALGNGDGSFQLHETLSLPLLAGPVSVAVADLDGDGLNDIGDAAVLSSVNSSRDLGLARIDINVNQALHVNLKYYADRARTVNDSYESSFTPSSPLDASRRGDVVGAQVISVINRLGAFYLEMTKAELAAGAGLLDGFVIWAWKTLSLTTPPSPAPAMSASARAIFFGVCSSASWGRVSGLAWSAVKVSPSMRA